MQKQEIINELVKELEFIKFESLENVINQEELAPFEIYGEDEAEKFENLALAIEIFEKRYK